MATMKFSTNAKCGGCVARIGEKLNGIMKSDEWYIDLNTPEKQLTVTADVKPEAVIAAVESAGFKSKQL